MMCGAYIVVHKYGKRNQNAPQFKVVGVSLIPASPSQNARKCQAPNSNLASFSRSCRLLRMTLRQWSAYGLQDQIHRGGNPCVVQDGDENGDEEEDPKCDERDS